MHVDFLLCYQTAGLWLIGAEGQAMARASPARFPHPCGPIQQMIPASWPGVKSDGGWDRVPGARCRHAAGARCWWPPVIVSKAGVTRLVDRPSFPRKRESTEIRILEVDSRALPRQPWAGN